MTAATTCPYDALQVDPATSKYYPRHLTAEPRLPITFEKEPNVHQTGWAAFACSLRNSRRRSSARNRCEILFLSSARISAYVSPPLSRGSKTASQPNLPSPRAGTMWPSVRPSNRTGSCPGPAE